MRSLSLKMAFTYHNDIHRKDSAQEAIDTFVGPSYQDSWAKEETNKSAAVPRATSDLYFSFEY